MIHVSDNEKDIILAETSQTPPDEPIDTKDLFFNPKPSFSIPIAPLPPSHGTSTSKTKSPLKPGMSKPTIPMPLCHPHAPPGLKNVMVSQVVSTPKDYNIKY